MKAGARREFTLHSSGKLRIRFSFFSSGYYKTRGLRSRAFFVLFGCSHRTRALPCGLTFGPGKRDLKTEMDSTGFEPVKSRWLPPFEPGLTFGPGKRDLKTAMDSTGFEPVAFTLQT